ncbi:MAG: hypothetical protein DSZ16_03255 [Candidatus Thioglobus sp.]|nr:MAG: hypothetical protein DSZ14_08580 [Candidatus Thioglobus sp.]RUM81953.1 MAG: hypothetical protein DSZ16_03255 [Candidatus Thioglobus sp.]
MLNLLLAGCTLSSITEPFTSLITKSESVDKDKSETIKTTKASSRIISVKGKHIEEVSIVSVKEIKKDFNTRESYQECYTKKYDKNQNEATLITSFFNTSKDSHIASVEFCETKYRNKQESRLMHYLVEYDYEGNAYTYTTKKKPDTDSVKVKVIVVPEAYKGKISN